MNDAIHRVTQRIIEKSKASRQRYLDLIAREGEKGINRASMSCGNLAHGFAASGQACHPHRQGNEYRHRHRL
jgi:phosphogluconate dehydratase